MGYFSEMVKPPVPAVRPTPPLSSGGTVTSRNVCNTCNQVLVQFRPHSAYEGEFGFDWLRMGDTAMYGDALAYADFSTAVPTYNMLGKYYEFKNTSTSGVESFSVPLTGRNGWKNCKDATTGVTKTKAQCSGSEVESIYFKESMTMYNNLISETYKTMNLAWKTALEPSFKYYVPIVSLIPDIEVPMADGTFSVEEGNSAKLAVHIEINVAPNDIRLKPQREDTGVEFKVDGIESSILSIQDGVHDAHLEIRCRKPLTSNLTVDVYAESNLCGRFTILQNDSSVVVSKKVLLVEVESDLNATTADPTIKGEPKIGGQDLLDNCLKQALIKADIQYIEHKSLNVTHTETSGVHEFRNQFSERVGSKYVVKKNPELLLGYLNGKFASQFPTVSYDYIVYFIGEEGVYNGFAQSAQRAGVYFPTHSKSTIAHELFHAMGLPHTFTNSEASANARFTYKATMTNNLMDYSHFHHKKRMLTFYWQWKILNGSVPRV